MLERGVLSSKNSYQRLQMKVKTQITTPTKNNIFIASAQTTSEVLL
jgi:hypothetical protein